MARLPWATGNLLIVFTPNDIIKEPGPCVRPLPDSRRKREKDRKRKPGKGIRGMRWMKGGRGRDWTRRGKGKAPD